MKIAVVGATGMVGSRVVHEAGRRGHHVTAVCRGMLPEATSPGVTAVQGDAADRRLMTALFAGHDAIVGATRPRPGEEAAVTVTTAALLDAAAAAGTPILIVGGAGPLRVPGDTGGTEGTDRLAIDDPDYVPEPYRAYAAASVAQLDTCREHPARWSYLSPPAVLEPGQRTAVYRRGGTTLLTDADGISRISAEDLAVAVLDELERPSGTDHFTVAY